MMDTTRFDAIARRLASRHAARHAGRLGLAAALPAPLARVALLVSVQTRTTHLMVRWLVPVSIG
jgi:hypothetical protein